MKTLIPPFGSHFMILLGGMSEKTRKPLSLIPQQPSDQSKPSPSTSITAPAGTSLSKAGSSRSIEPIDLGVRAVEVERVMTMRPKQIRRGDPDIGKSLSEEIVALRIGVYRLEKAEAIVTVQCVCA